MVLTKLVLANLTQHRVRVGLTVAAIALSVSLVVAVTSGYSSAEAEAQKYLGHYMGSSDVQITRKADPHGTFSEDIVDALKRDPTVALAIGRYEGESSVLDDKGTPRPGKPPQLIGVRRPQDKEVDSLELEAGGWFNDSTGQVCVIDQVVAALYKVDIGGTLTLPGIDKKLVVKVIGIVHKPAILAADTQTIYLPIETLQTFLGKPRAVNRVSVTLQSGADDEAFKDRWEPRLSQNNPPLKMKSARDLRKQMEQNLSSVRFLSYLGGTVSMLAATFIVFSALSMGVGERTRTLAMLRAVGMFKGQIARLVFAEGFLLAAMGVLVGVPLGLLWVKILVVYKRSFFTSGMVIDWLGIGFGVGVSMLAALVASLLPAYGASRVSPLEAMNPHGKTGSNRVPWVATLAGLLLIGIDPLVIFAPFTSREAKLLLHFVVGLPGVMVGFFLLAPLAVWTTEFLGSWLVARLLGLKPALLRQQLSGGLWRAAGTCAALMVGLAILVVMQVQGHSMLKGWKLPNRFPDIFIVSFDGLNNAQQQKLKNVPGVKPNEIMGIAFAPAKIVNEHLDLKGASLIPESTMFFGVDPDKALDMMELEFRNADGTTPTPKERDLMSASAAAALKLGRHLIITDEFRQLLGKKVGDKLTLRTPRGGDVDYTIAGIVWSPGIDVIVSMFDMGAQFDERTASSVFGSLADIRRDFGMEDIYLFAANLESFVDKNKLVSDMAAETSKAATPPAATPDLLNNAKRIFGINSGTRPTSGPTTSPDRGSTLAMVKKSLGLSGLRAGDVRHIKYQIEQGFERLLLLLSSVAFSAMLVAALGVTNTIMASIRSRRWQFGILRSIGVTRSQLLRLVLGEAILLGVVGCVLGLAAGFLMSLDANGLNKFILGYVVPMTPPWGMIGVGSLIVMIVATVASLWPAFTVARTEPLTLLQAGRSAG